MALKKKALPAPNQYNKCLDWAVEAIRNKDNFQKFSKSKRVTETDKILERRKLKEPGPQTYNWKENYKPNVLPLCKNSPQTVMLNEAKFKGLATPGCKYNPNYNAFRPKSAHAIICFKARVTG
jgi:hypothetical protein